MMKRTENKEMSPTILSTDEKSAGTDSGTKMTIPAYRITDPDSNTYNLSSMRRVSDKEKWGTANAARKISKCDNTNITTTIQSIHGAYLRQKAIHSANNEKGS